MLSLTEDRQVLFGFLVFRVKTVWRGQNRRGSHVKEASAASAASASEVGSLTCWYAGVSHKLQQVHKLQSLKSQEQRRLDAFARSKRVCLATFCLRRMCFEGCFRQANRTVRVRISPRHSLYFRI